MKDEPEDLCVCPQCRGRGVVPFVSTGGARMSNCPLCRGKNRAERNGPTQVSMAFALGQGWPREAMEQI